MNKALKYPWRATLVHGDRCSVFLDREDDERMPETFTRNTYVTVTEEEKLRLEQHVVMLPVPNAVFHDRRVPPQPIYTVKKLFTFTPNPSGQRSTG